MKALFVAILLCLMLLASCFSNISSGKGNQAYPNGTVISLLDVYSSEQIVFTSEKLYTLKNLPDVPDGREYYVLTINKDGKVTAKITASNFGISKANNNELVLFQGPLTSHRTNLGLEKAAGVSYLEPSVTSTSTTKNKVLDTFLYHGNGFWGFSYLSSESKKYYLSLDTLKEETLSRGILHCSIEAIHLHEDGISVQEVSGNQSKRDRLFFKDSTQQKVFLEYLVESGLEQTNHKFWLDTGSE